MTRAATRRPRSVLRSAVFIGALVLAAGCADTAGQLNRGIEDISSELAELLSGGRLPSEHIDVIRSVHLENSLTFDPRVENPVEKVRGAIRGLAESDYATWRDTAFTLQLLSSLAREHPVALVRAEALDAVADMGRWTFEREVDTGDWASQAELIAALRVIGDAASDDAYDPAKAFTVADAIRTASAYDFEGANPLPESVNNRTVGRDLVTRLRHTRGVLMPITGVALEDYLVDPDVLSATDRCCVALSASMIRLTLGSAAMLDPSAVARDTAVRLLGQVPFDGAPRLLVRVLRDDGDPGVRRQAVRSLASFGIDAAGEALIAALTDDTASVRGAATRQLEALSGQRFGDDRRAWVRWWSERAPVGDGDTSETRR